MKYINDEIISVAAKLNIRIHVLQPSEASEIFGQLRSRYGRPGTLSKPLWEHLLSSEIIHDPNGWAHGLSYFGGGSVILLVEGEIALGYVFGSSLEIRELLSNSIGFEFYVTEPDMNSLVAFNDHDVLILCGDAENRARVLSTPESIN